MAFNFDKRSSYNEYGNDGSYGNYNNGGDYGSSGYGDQQNDYGGFQNMPVMRDEPDHYGAYDDYNSGYDGCGDSYYPAPSPKKWPKKRNATRRFGNDSIPRPVNPLPIRMIFTILCIASCLILCWIFREEITEFIAQLLVWIIVLCAAVGVLKFFFGRGRR